MKILYVSVEVAPYAKVGGLADVAGSLPQALHEAGHDVRVFMPAYKMVLDDPQFKVKTKLEDFKVSINNWWHKRAKLHEANREGVPIYMVSTDEWFSDVDRSERIYAQGVDAYLFFARALFMACEQLGWIPDVIHCNDWHSGFIPVLLREQAGSQWSETGSVYSIHNLAYQGEFGPEVLDKVGLPRSLFNLHQLEAFGSVNFLKSGCVFADQVNTVSERYAEEIQTPEFGCRLDGFMEHIASQGRLTGIVNGLDQHEWNPATDLRLAANYDADHPQQKAKCREALLGELKLEPIEGAPVLGVVSRLSSQKGMDVMLEAAQSLFEMPVQLIVQGLGDPLLSEQFRALEKVYPKHFRFVQKFDVGIAQHIYSGSDMFLMPSSFEPCGLGQLIAMRYGTVPVVRATGGLADTVFEGENGFVFAERSTAEMLEAIHRAVAVYHDQAAWSSLIERAMRSDHSWTASAQRYEQLYLKSILARRSSESIAV